MNHGLVASALLALAIWPGAVDAANPQKCQRKTAELAADHVADADKLLARFATRRDALTERFLGSLEAGSERAAAMRAALERAANPRDFDDYRATYIEKVVADLELVGDPANEHALCDDIRKLKLYSKDSLERLRDGLDRFVDVIENRIDIESVDDDEGLAAIAVFVFGWADEIVLNRRGAITGSVKLGPLHNAEYFEVLKLPAGEYNWTTVKRKNGDYTWTHDFGGEDLSFVVRPGKLNYTGVFVYDVDGLYALGTLNDRAAIVLTILEQRYPALMNRYPLHNGLVETDTFIDYYVAEKRLLGETGAAE